MSLTYRIRKKTGNANVSLRYRPSKDIDLWISTPFKLPAEEWDQINQCYNRKMITKSPRTDNDKIKNDKVKTFNHQLEMFFDEVQTFISGNNYKVEPSQLKNIIDEKFNQKKSPTVNKPKVPTLMTEFIDYYIEQKSVSIPGVQREISKGTIRTYHNLRNRIKKFNKNLKVEDVNDDFRIAYTKWGTQKYTESTIHNNLKKIKSFVTFAEGKKLNIDKSVLNWKFIEPQKTYSEPIITFEEQKRIMNLQLEGTLANTRDWILISCQVGLRISDLLKLKKEMIIDDCFIQIKQKKVGSEVVFPLPKRSLEILKKRNGEFPPTVSHQKFNKHIKTICHLAEMNSKMMGGKRLPNSKKILGMYEKWELITSHSCRRTFVTLYRAVVKNDELLQNNTGHTTKQMLDQYDVSPLSKENARTLKKIIDQFHE